MWSSKASKWSPNTNTYEKFIVERFIQRCDPGEIISNKHRSVNGYTQLKELIKFSLLSFKRGRTIKTLIAIIEESRSKFIKQNIANDLIIDKYFYDLKKYIVSYNSSNLLGNNSQPNLSELRSFFHSLKVFEIQLEKNYFNCLKEEFINIKIDDEKEFNRTAIIISDIIDALIPYLVFNGYSLSTIKGLLIRWLMNGYHITVKKTLSIFSFKKDSYSFYFIINESHLEVSDFIEQLRNVVNADIEKIRASDIDAIFCEKNALSGDEIVLIYDFETIDPHNHVRFCYDDLFKKLIIQKERLSLNTFNNFFENTFWSYHKKRKKINKIVLDGDSINVSSRAHTLRTTLSKIIVNGEFTSDANLPITKIDQLNNAIFYYNLALGSKSIENSLSLLWTSLEAILPYRTAISDIECIQDWVSKSLSVGSLSRDIYGFSLRFIQQNAKNDNCLSELETRMFESNHTKAGLLSWFGWMTNPEIANKYFVTVKSCSELLAFQYSRIGEKYATCKQDDILSRILASQESIKYQLQRIYIHRNQIVHAGDLINEYSNLWTHLEWYVGKLLSYFLINIHFFNKFDTLENAALELVADFDYMVSYFEKNKNKKCLDMPERLKDMLFDNSWQYY